MFQWNYNDLPISYSEFIAFREKLALDVNSDELPPYKLAEMRKLLEHLYLASQELQDKEIVMVLGNTGAGKSATICYLMGKKFVVDKSKIALKAKLLDGFDEKRVLPIIGDTASSQTEVSSLYSDSSFNYCDNPGFLENRSLAKVISTTISIHAALYKAARIRAILVVIDINSFYAERWLGIRELHKMLATLIIDPQSLSHHILFIVTKTEPQHTLAKVILRLRELIIYFQDKLKKLNKEPPSSDVDNEKEIANSAIQLLELMLKHYDNILLLNIENSDHIAIIRSHIAKTNYIPKNHFSLSPSNIPEYIFFEDKLFTTLKEWFSNIKQTPEIVVAIAARNIELTAAQEKIANLVVPFSEAQRKLDEAKKQMANANDHKEVFSATLKSSEEGHKTIEQSITFHTAIVNQCQKFITEQEQNLQKILQNINEQNGLCSQAFSLLQLIQATTDPTIIMRLRNTIFADHLVKEIPELSKITKHPLWQRVSEGLTTMLPLINQPFIMLIGHDDSTRQIVFDLSLRKASYVNFQWAKWLYYDVNNYYCDWSNVTDFANNKEFALQQLQLINIMKITRFKPIMLVLDTHYNIADSVIAIAQSLLGILDFTNDISRKVAFIIINNTIKIDYKTQTMHGYIYNEIVRNELKFARLNRETEPGHSCSLHHAVYQLLKIIKNPTTSLLNLERNISLVKRQQQLELFIKQLAPLKDGLYFSHSAAMQCKELQKHFNSPIEVCSTHYKNSLQSQIISDAKPIISEQAFRLHEKLITIMNETVADPALATMMEKWLETLQFDITSEKIQQFIICWITMAFHRYHYAPTSLALLRQTSFFTPKQPEEKLAMATPTIVNLYDAYAIDRILQQRLTENNIPQNSKKIKRYNAISFERLEKKRFQVFLQVALQNTLKENLIAILPLELTQNNWMGLVIKKVTAQQLQIIYCDPSGMSLSSDSKIDIHGAIEQFKKNNANIRIDFYDMKVLQHSDYAYSAAFTIENLLTLIDHPTLTNYQKILDCLPMTTEANYFLDEHFKVCFR